MVIALILVHLQAVLVPLWVALRCRGRLLRAGFSCFALASLAEMVDHTTTDWIYVNRISLFNGVFYGALAAGLALLTAAVTCRALRSGTGVPATRLASSMPRMYSRARTGSSRSTSASRFLGRAG